MTTNEWLVPTVEDALLRYRAWAVALRANQPRCGGACWWCLPGHLHMEAASVALDMAFALASEERIRASIAWA